MQLDRTNIDTEVTEYLRAVDSIEFPTPRDDLLLALYALKRQPVDRGPYPGVSVFEAANRIFSDLVIFFAVRRLLLNPVVGAIRLPFTEYKVALGTKGGPDLVATVGDCRLVGEAFNVAPSFFQTKKSSVLKKLRAQKDADYRLVVFNADAVSNPDSYLKRSRPLLLYLPVDIWSDRRDLISNARDKWPSRFRAVDG